MPGDARNHLQAAYPVILTHLTYLPLVDLVGRVEAGLAGQTGHDRDWSDFNYRMGFIGRLFRSYHVRDELLQAPASPVPIDARPPHR